MAYAVGSPLLPVDDEQVLEVLPAGPLQKELDQLRRQLQQQPANQQLAAKLVEHYLDIHRRSGDERYLGYAEQVLRPFPRPVDELALTKAVLLQRQHRFDSAARILQHLIQQSPANGEAHLILAYIDMARGRADVARRHCASAVFAVGPAVVAACDARASSLSGDAEQAYQALLRLLDNIEMDELEAFEIHYSLAEISARLGHFENAHMHLDRALNVEPQNLALLTFKADLLLWRGDFHTCYRLLRTRQDQPALLLRYAVAVNTVGDIEAFNVLAAKLQRHFAYQLLRDPAFASRDYANYLLQVEKDPQAALKIARANWQNQREPADSYTVLASAVAARETSSVDDIVAWIKTTGLNDYRINSLLRVIAENTYTSGRKL